MAGRKAYMLALAMVALGAQAMSAQSGSAPPHPEPSYAEMFARYLTEAHARPPAPDTWQWMTGLAIDPRARRTNDLITINVVENITGSGSANSGLTKASTGNAAVTAFFGLPSHFPSSVDPAALAATKSATDFKGTGTTTRAGQLTAQLTARVTDVLPNGDLVVEGVREIIINGDQQLVVLTGVIRLNDISPANVVQSTSIAQLSIRYFGRGLIKDNLNPGWLIRVLNKIF